MGHMEPGVPVVISATQHGLDRETFEPVYVATEEDLRGAGPEMLHAALFYFMVDHPVTGDRFWVYVNPQPSPAAWLDSLNGVYWREMGVKPGDFRRLPLAGR